MELHALAQVFRVPRVEGVVVALNNVNVVGHREKLKNDVLLDFSSLDLNCTIVGQ